MNSDVQWLIPRQATEAIPPGSTLLRIAVFPYAARFTPRIRTRQRPVSVTSRRRIERVAALVNALPLAQPRSGIESCPAPLGAVLRLAFYGRSRSTPVAVVRDNLVPCGRVELELNGHGEPALEEGWEPPALTERVSEAIGVKLDTRISEASGR